MTDLTYFIGTLDGKNTSVVIDLPKMIGIKCSTIIGKDLMQSLVIICLCFEHVLLVIDKEETGVYILIILRISADSRNNAKSIYYSLRSPFSTTAEVMSIRSTEVFISHQFADIDIFEISCEVTIV